MERQYKDSGIEWIGSIPETWEVLQIRRFMRNRSERNQPDAMILSLYRDLGVVPKSSRDDNHNVTSEDTANYKVVSKGNFVINKMKAWQGSMAVSDYDGIVSPAYYVCTFTRDVYKRYIHYLLRDASYKPEYMRLSTGMRIGQWDLNIDDFLRIKAILPPLSEQQHIADYLDKKCGEIDALVELQEQMIAQLKDYKQSVITEAVTKGLNPDVEFVPSGIDWIGKIPIGWRTLRLKDIGTLYGGLTGKSGTDFEVEEEDVFAYYIPFTNIFNNMVIDTSNLYKVKMKEGEIQNEVHKGDLLFLMSSEDFDGIGKPSLLDESVPHLYLNSFCKGLRIKYSNVSSKFLLYTMTAHIMREQIRLEAKGFIRINLRQEKLMNVVLSIPSFNEQQAIASYLDKKCADIDRLIALKQQKIETLKEYKKSLIYEAVTGKIDLTA